MSRVYLSRQEAEAGGRVVDTSVYPWRVRQTRGADPHTPPPTIVRTDIEAKLGRMLAELEWSAEVETESGIGMHPEPTCPSSRALKSDGAHKPGCDLAEALGLYRGDPVSPRFSEPAPGSASLTVDRDIGRSRSSSNDMKLPG